MALIFDEGFETATTGYEELSGGASNGWSTINAGGGTVDPVQSVDDVETATGLTLAAWDTQCLELSGGTSEVSIRTTMDSQYAELYIRFDVIFGNIADMAEGVNNILFYTTTGYTTDCITIYTKLTGGVPYFYAKLENSGGDVWLSTYQIAINTRYRVDIHFVGNGTCQVIINGTSLGTGTCTTTQLNTLKFFKSPDTSSNAALYIDDIQLATDGWIPADTSISSSASATPSPSASASSTPSSSESASASTTTEINLEQEGFRFRNDDGDESNATWLGEQDAGATILRNTNYRIRFVVNALSGDAPSTQFKLQYKKVADEVWLDVPSSE